MKTKVILISGHAQNGKDTSAQIMLDVLKSKGHSAIIIHYADLLKYLCKQYFGWNGEKDEAGRGLLQRVGTDVIRARRPNYWVDFVKEFLTVMDGEWDYVIVPDTRFPNEIDQIKSQFDTTHIRVIRKNFTSPLTIEQQNHPSETALDYHSADFIIENTTLEKLKEAVEMISTIVAGEQLQ